MPSNHSHILLDITKVTGTVAGAGVITLANINVGLTTLSICLAICYTIWKWRKDLRK